MHPKHSLNAAPLNGIPVLTLSSKKLAPELHKALKKLGAKVKSCFLYDIILMPEEQMTLFLRQIHSYSYVVLTSRNACECLYAALLRCNVPVDAVPPLVVLGEKSYAECLRLGFAPEIVPECFSVEGLMKRLDVVALAGKAVLVLQGNLSDARLGEYFEKRLARVDRCVLYENRPRKLSVRERMSLCSFDCAYLVFTSPSSVEYYVQLCGVPDVECIALGQRSAAALHLYGAKRVSVPSVSTIEGVLECLLQKHSPKQS